jgi:hypothetical protein
MRLLSFLPLISSDRIRLLEAVSAFGLGLSGVIMPNLALLFLPLSGACLVLALLKIWFENRFNIEIDSNKSSVLIVDESDREPAEIGEMTFKTHNRIEIRVSLRFISDSASHITIKKDIPGTLLQTALLGRKKRVGVWTHLLNKNPIVIPANAEVQRSFRWTNQLPEDFKYSSRNSPCFFRFYVCPARRIPRRFDLPIKWTGLRTGCFVCK